MQTIGERLEEARKRKGVSIREAAEATKVRGDYLQKFEGNHFDIGLAEIYVRGFLGIYCAYLRLPADRLIADYTAELGRGEAKPRQPSREVYGRMDLSVASVEESRPERPPVALRPSAAPVAEPPAAPEPARPAPHVPRSGMGGPFTTPAINPALVFKGLIVVGMVIAALLIIWIAKALFGSGPATVERPAAAAASSAVQSAPDATVAVVALDPVRIKVVRQSDNAELFQGQLDAGGRHEFPNIPLYLTATALESVRIEYMGKQYDTRMKGYNRVRIDFSAAR
jgi:cytoskeletal protein RodZ